MSADQRLAATAILAASLLAAPAGARAAASLDHAVQAIRDQQWNAAGAELAQLATPGCQALPEYLLGVVAAHRQTYQAVVDHEQRALHCKPDLDPAYRPGAIALRDWAWKELARPKIEVHVTQSVDPPSRDQDTFVNKSVRIPSPKTKLNKPPAPDPNTLIDRAAGSPCQGSRNPEEAHRCLAEAMAGPAPVPETPLPPPPQPQP